MPKRTLKQFTPSPERMREIKSLRVLGDWIYESNLWHLNRYSASMAFFVGLFVAFMPLPGQMIIAAFAAVALRCNLPISVGLAWITNPVTMPAIFYLAYRVGSLLLGVPTIAFEIELSLEWLSNSLAAIWQPFLLGCFVCGTLFGSLGYFLISILWRWQVGRRWRRRQRRRRRKATRTTQGSAD